MKLGRRGGGEKDACRLVDSFANKTNSISDKLGFAQ